MTDIVERLKQGPVEKEPLGKFVRCYDIEQTTIVMRKAAAEIERLRERVKELENRTLKCAKCCGRGEVRGPSDSGYMDCPACDGRGN